MSIFSSLMQAIKPVHDDLFGDVVTLTLSGNGSTAMAVLGKARTVTRVDEDGRRYRLTIRPCRLGSETAVDHTATITDGNGEVWSIDEVHSRQASGLYLTLRRSEVRDVTRPGYRRRP